MSNKRDAAHLIRELCTFMAFSKIRFLTMIGEIYEPLEMRIVLDQIIDPAQNKVRIEDGIVILVPLCTRLVEFLIYSRITVCIGQMLSH